MPTGGEIADSLASITREWRALAIAWHAAFIVAAITLSYLRSSQRMVATAIVLPLVSVSALAWWSGNPFNGTVFASAAAVLLAETRAFVSHTVRMSSRLRVIAGVLLVVFGLVYPHFVA